MFLLEQVEVLDKVDRGMRVAAVWHHWGAMEPTVYFAKKKKISRPLLLAHDAVSLDNMFSVFRRHCVYSQRREQITHVPKERSS